MWFQCCVEGQ
jgi:hypothetical protein